MGDGVEEGAVKVSEGALLLGDICGILRKTIEKKRR